MKTGLNIVVALLICLNGISAMAQAVSSDSLTVERAVQLTLKSHAAIRQSEYDMAAAAAGIDVSRSALYPDISLGGDYTHIGPVPEFELPGQGTLQLAPYNNYDLHASLKQTLYDFGRTNKAVSLAEASHQAATDNVDLVKFNLAYGTIGVFNAILILHQRIDVLDEQLQTLMQHLDISIKKINAGTATDFDTLTIQVKIAVIQSERIDAVHALKTQEIMFRQLTGLSSDTPINLKGSFVTDKMALNADSLIMAADNQRPELTLARDAESSAEARSQLVSLDDKPTLSLHVTTGLNNGYEPDLNTLRGNYAAGVELKIPVFNGHRTKFKRAAADAGFNSARAHTSDVEQRVRSEVLQAVAGVNSNLDKITSTETQVQQAQKAVEMARVRYSTGVITNLDLLDAETTLSQAKLIRLRALYDYTVSRNELDRTTGRKIW